MPISHDVAPAVAGRSVVSPQPFSGRLLEVIRGAAPEGALIHITQQGRDPAPAGMDVPVEVRVIHSSYEGLDEADREDPLWQAVLDRLWDEQGLVRSILPLTPAELETALRTDED